MKKTSSTKTGVRLFDREHAIVKKWGGPLFAVGRRGRRFYWVAWRSAHDLYAPGDIVNLPDALATGLADSEAEALSAVRSIVPTALQLRAFYATNYRGLLRMRAQERLHGRLIASRIESHRALLGFVRRGLSAWDFLTLHNTFLPTQALLPIDRGAIEYAIALVRGIAPERDEELVPADEADALIARALARPMAEK